MHTVYKNDEERATLIAGVRVRVNGLLNCHNLYNSGFKKLIFLNLTQGSQLAIDDGELPARTSTPFL